MPLLNSLIAGFSDAEPSRHLVVAILSTVVISVFIRIASTVLALADYSRFYRQHTDFYKRCRSLKTRTLYMRLPVPWASETTYYLLDHEPMRKLFARSTKLDAFGLAYRLHKSVWGVPKPVNAGILREATKQIHRELSAKKLGPVSKSFEAVIRDDIATLREKIGPNGRLVPFHTTFYRIAYAGNLKAIYGPDLPVAETRVALQNFAANLRALNTTPSLPLLPTEWWNGLIPSARKGAQARDRVTNALIKWQRDGGLETCSETWRSIMRIVLDGQVDIVHANRWVNMVLFGFQGNTGEQPGWAFLYLLQSPKLWSAIRAEVDSLPPDSLVGTDFRRATPLMYSAIHETLRLSTAVFAGRTTTGQTKLDGCNKVFPKGVLIRIMSRASVFDPAVWGEDADCFKGDRFVKNEDLYKEELFFGGGVSACPGRHFAMAELELLMAHLIKTFEFDLTSLCMHKKLAPEAEDLMLGPAIDTPEHKCSIIDLDGTRIEGVYPGISDAENCMESVSGSLYPLQESTCILRVRQG